MKAVAYANSVTVPSRNGTGGTASALTALLAEMQSLARILPVYDIGSHDVLALDEDDVVETQFDNMPV